MTAPLFYDVVFYGGLLTIGALLWWKRHQVRNEWFCARMNLRRLVAEHRVEQQRPDVGLNVLGSCCPHTHRSFADHVDDALDVFPIDDDPPDLIDAGRELQHTPADQLWAAFTKEMQ